MDFVVVTTCTNRKRVRPARGLQARSLKCGLVGDVARQWADKIRTAPSQANAIDLYCGRGFQEAVNTSSANDMPLFVISAGLGIVSVDQQLPSYDLTLANGSSDSIQKKVVEAILPTDWWHAISTALGRKMPVADLVQDYRKQRVLIACSEIYAQMIARDIEMLPESDQRRIRIFGPRDPSRLPSVLHPFIMPYDERFDGANGPLRGTRSDFPQRTLRHFVELLMPRSLIADDPESDAALIRESHKKWAWPDIPIRRKMSDEQIMEMVPKFWEQARGGSARMLRILRDQELVACEQRRFGMLFKLAKERYAL